MAAGSFGQVEQKGKLVFAVCGPGHPGKSVCNEGGKGDTGPKGWGCVGGPRH